MHANKLNVFHWHLTDRESWPRKMEPASGAGRVGMVLKIGHPVDTAANLGIRVIVEVDLPGHIRVLGASHPELISESMIIRLPDVIDPTNNATMVLVRDIFAN